jgi:predicted Fe-Mo cluster-binding NifX family protein
MKICITSQGSTLDALAEERFGRAPFFIIVDTETGSFEAIENQFGGGSGGVGPKAAQILISQKVEALVSGMVGGNAHEVLQAAGIPLYVYRSGGTVRDALEQFNKKTLIPVP